MKKLLITSAVLTLAVSGQALAEENSENNIIPGNISGAVTFVSDYAFRGISQTSEGPALQANLDYQHDRGIYAGMWGSNLDYQSTPDANLEMDFYSGYTFSKEGFDFNVGGIYYAYPGVESSQGFDFFEAQAAVTKDFDIAAVTGSVNFSPDYFGDSGKATYYKGTINIPILKNFSIVDETFSKIAEAVDTPFKNYGVLTKSYGFISNNIGIVASIGHQTIEKNNNYGAPDYTDWSVGAQFALQGFNVLVQYVDTNINKNRCFDGCDERVVISASKSF